MRQGPRLSELCALRHRSLVLFSPYLGPRPRRGSDLSGCSSWGKGTFWKGLMGLGRDSEDRDISLTCLRPAIHRPLRMGFPPACLSLSFLGGFECHSDVSQPGLAWTCLPGPPAGVSQQGSRLGETFTYMVWGGKGGAPSEAWRAWLPAGPSELLRMVAATSPVQCACPLRVGSW